MARRRAIEGGAIIRSLDSLQQGEAGFLATDCHARTIDADANDVAVLVSRDCEYWQSGYRIGATEI